MRPACWLPPNLARDIPCRVMPFGRHVRIELKRPPGEFAARSPAACASAFSSRRLPMKHHGQITSSTMSMRMRGHASDPSTSPPLTLARATASTMRCMTGIYDAPHLARGAANHVALTPLSFLARAAAVHPGKLAVDPRRAALHLCRALRALLPPRRRAAPARRRAGRYGVGDGAQRAGAARRRITASPWRGRC